MSDASGLWPVKINSVSEIISGFDLILCDLWGVIHDGSALYPNARSTLEKIHDAGKRLIFISNAPRRAKVAEETLHRLGIHRPLYEDIVTSGEVGFQTVASSQWPDASKYEVRSTKYEDNTTSNEQRTTNNYFYLGPLKDENILEDSKLTRTLNVKEAAFVMCTGLINEDDPLEIYDFLLEQMLDANVPMICVNPDFIVVKQDGRVINCSGLIAEKYRNMGGQMRYFGKPYPEIYDYIFSHQAAGIPKEKILAIGDSIEHDIKGANTAGIKSVLVTGGIIKTTLDLEGDTLPDNSYLQKISEESGAKPDWVIASFKW